MFFKDGDGNLEKDIGLLNIEHFPEEPESMEADWKQIRDNIPDCYISALAANEKFIWGATQIEGENDKAEIGDIYKINHEKDNIISLSWYHPDLEAITCSMNALKY